MLITHIASALGLAEALLPCSRAGYTVGLKDLFNLNDSMKKQIQALLSASYF